MKKRISIFLIAAFYLMSTSGMAIGIHYCMGKVSSIELFASKKNPCSCGEKETKKSCCKDEVKQLKTDPSKASQTTVKFQKVSQVPVDYFRARIPIVDDIFKKTFSLRSDHQVSDSDKVPLYLRNSVFLI